MAVALTPIWGPLACDVLSAATQPPGVCRSPIGKSPGGSDCYLDHRPDDRATGRSLDRFLTARETGPTAAGVAINIRESEPLSGWYRRG